MRKKHAFILPRLPVNLIAKALFRHEFKYSHFKYLPNHKTKSHPHNCSSHINMKIFVFFVIFYFFFIFVLFCFVWMSEVPHFNLIVI